LNLFAMSGGKLHDGFDFDDDAVFDDEIGFESFVETQPPINDGNGHLSPHAQASALEFVSQDRFVDRLQQSGSECPVHLNPRRDHPFTNLILIHDFKLCAFAPQAQRARDPV
jgi:hypothetical protein